MTSGRSKEMRIMKSVLGEDFDKKLVSNLNKVISKDDLDKDLDRELMGGLDLEPDEVKDVMNKM